jgi:clan AA aspartic protease (TIGR02281 family)
MGVAAKLVCLGLALTGLSLLGACAQPSEVSQAPAPAPAAAPAAPPTPVAQGTSVATEVPVEADNGTFVVPVTLNDTITLKFTIDSGASDVSIPADVASTLVRSGTITNDDFIGSQTYTLADGSQVPSTTFRIRTLKVGTLVLHDVTASLANARGPLLLGQSFLQRMSAWSFDNARQVLVLKAATQAADQVAAVAPADPSAVATPVTAGGAPEPTSPEILLSDADLTHVAAQFHRTFRSQGMNGVSQAVARCYAAIPTTSGPEARRSAAFCVTLDLVAMGFDTGFRRELAASTSKEIPPEPFYETSAWQQRLQTYLPLTTAAHAMPPMTTFREYEHNVERKLTILMEAERDGARQ